MKKPGNLKFLSLDTKIPSIVLTTVTINICHGLARKLASNQGVNTIANSNTVLMTTATKKSSKSAYFLRFNQKDDTLSSQRSHYLEVAEFLFF